MKFYGTISEFCMGVRSIGLLISGFTGLSVMQMLHMLHSVYYTIKSLERGDNKR